MGAFEDFIQDELPLRQVVVKSSGDPTSGDGYIAAIGTYYLDTSNSFKRYEKVGSGNVDWRAVPTSSDTGGVETESINFLGTSKITTSALASQTGDVVLDQFSSDDFKSAKYIVSATGGTTPFSAEVLLLVDGDQVYMTQYGVLGDSDVLTISATVDNTTVTLDAVTDDSSYDISIYKFLLG